MTTSTIDNLPKSSDDVRKMSLDTTEEPRKAGVKGRRIPGKPGRFDPDRPLHMTTRRAAKHSVTDSTPSVNGSMEDDESRRGSLDEVRPTTSYSNASQLSAKTDEPLEHFANRTISPAIESGESKSDGDAIEVQQEVSRSFFPILQAASPSRKRKRSSISPPRTPNRTPSDIAVQSQDDVPEMPQDSDFVDLEDPRQLSDRELTEGSSPSEERVHDNANMPAPSTDATPPGSMVGSPASSMSASDEESPTKAIEEQVDIVMQDVHAEALEADGIQEMEDIDEQQQSDEDGRTKRPFAGGRRRRAKHPIPRVEKSMRRQAELKVAFRQIARALKPVLMEISQRSLDDLYNSEESYKQATEYNEVIAGLDNALGMRQVHLHAQRQLDKALLLQKLKDEEEVRILRAQRQVEDLKDMQLYQLEHRMLEIARAAQLKSDGGGYDTEDEDDVVPRPKRTLYRFERTEALDPAHDSRSRPILETEKAIENLNSRYELRKMLTEFDCDEKQDIARKSTILDPATLNSRRLAIAKRDGVARTKSLAEAASEFERRSNIPVIQNKDAIGLQMLGDLATRPSIVSAAPPSIPRKRSRDNRMQQSPRRPPPLSLPPPQPHIPLQIELSPRTAQTLAERFDASAMPPPSTPRHADQFFAQSPVRARHEVSVPSPLVDANRTSGLAALAMRQSERESPQQHQHGLPIFLRRHLDWPDYRTDDGSEARNMSGDPQQQLSRSLSERHHLLYGIPDRRVPGNEERRDFASSNASLLTPTRDSQLLSVRSADRDRHRQPWPTLAQLRLLHDRPPMNDQPDSPSATDRWRDQRGSPTGQPPRPMLEISRSPRSRNSSMSQPPLDSRSDQSHLPADTEHRQRPNETWRGRKTNKLERQGASRRKWKAYKVKQEDDRDQKRHQPAGTHVQNEIAATRPTPVASILRAQGLPPASWQRPATPSSSLPPPPLTFSAPPPPFPTPSMFEATGPRHVPLAPPAYDPSQHHQHRNSFPPLQPPPPSWSQPAPSPLYAIPRDPRQSQPLPPPPGVPPEQWRAQPTFIPPPPPQHHQPPPTPPSAHPRQTVPGSIGQQYGGQPIAPAAPDPRYHFTGYGPQPPQSLPAFAQQQRQSDGPRRRAQSDAHQHHHNRWHSWNPASDRR